MSLQSKNISIFNYHMEVPICFKGGFRLLLPEFVFCVVRLYTAQKKIVNFHFDENLP